MRKHQPSRNSVSTMSSITRPLQNGVHMQDPHPLLRRPIKLDGIISIIGFVGGEAQEKEPGFLDCLVNMYRARFARRQQRNPVVDEKVFTLDEVKEAYQYMWDQKHFGKLAIKID
ncbi:hypothetical protein EYC84_000328 [Monilinia fructicola]|uniref:Alcohol dehydrogenase-like C-terminal domain-containing protein n=1 Tax=Monilinia fructicola TaxID=38448 RepID=A0A5M9JNW0_MONFR|nr:hypothetical protein EYC84_000328 [Monilinia fructicola]